MTQEEISVSGKTPNILIQTYPLFYSRNKTPIKSHSLSSSHIMYLLSSFQDHNSIQQQKAQDAKTLVKLISKINKSSFSLNLRLQDLSDVAFVQCYVSITRPIQHQGQIASKPSLIHKKTGANISKNQQQVTSNQTKISVQY